MSHDWALQVEEEEKDFQMVLEGWREKVVVTREWQELGPRTVRTVEAFKGLEDEAELSFEPGVLISGIRLASWVEDNHYYRSSWLGGTLEGRVGCNVEYLPAQSDSD